MYSSTPTLSIGEKTNFHMLLLWPLRVAVQVNVSDCQSLIDLSLDPVAMYIEVY